MTLYGETLPVQEDELHVVEGPELRLRTVRLQVPGRGRHRNRTRRAVGEWILVILLAICVALMVRHFLVQRYSIPSASMRPTLKEGDSLLVNKISYLWGDVERGDIIVFKKPPSMVADDIKDLVKRVVGLPGDTVEARDGLVYINGVKLAEPYLPAGTVTTDVPPTVVPIDEYFMMGDNRGNSNDSRFWGTIKRSEIVGKVFVRISPLSRIGRVT